MTMLTVDFETYYSKDFGFSKLTTEEYVRDERFEIIGVSIAEDHEEPVWYTGGHQKVIDQIKEAYDWENSLVLAHNMLFDGFILSHHVGVKAKGYLDTLCMARALHGVDAGGSLKALAERYNIGTKGTEVLDALGKRYKDFNKTDLAQYGEYCKNDVALTRMLFILLSVSFPKKELKLIDATLQMFIHPEFELNVPLLEHHLESTRHKKEKLLNAVGADKRELMSNAKFAELLQQCGVEPPTKISAKTGKVTWAFAKTDEAFKELTEHHDLRVQALVEARLGNKSTLEETRTERFINIASRGLLPIPLKYYGARTGRWSALDSVNMQNLPRGSVLKEAIQAPEGMVVVGADLSNIELRVGLWIAGQVDKLKLLGDGLDLYKDFASTVFNVSYDDVTKDQRFIGKTAQLSLIYGTGAIKLKDQIKSMSGTDIGIDLANQTVDVYRHTYHKVKDVWGSGSKALETILADTKGSIGQNYFAYVDGKKGIRLASGLYLQYPDLKKYTEDRKTKWDYAIRGGRDKLYGAKVFQGLTQATARCVMAEHMLAIQKRYKIALTVHDAVYLVVPEDEAEEALAFVINAMRKAPDWLPGIPLDAEGGYGKTLLDC